MREDGIHATPARAAQAVASHLLRAAIREATRHRSWVAHVRYAAVAFGELREGLAAR